MNFSSILSLASTLLVFIVFLIPFLYKVSDRRRKWYRKFSGWGVVMVACVLGNAAIQIQKDNISSQEQNKRDSTIAHLKASLDKIDSSVTKKFDSLGYKFELNTNRIIAKSDSAAISVATTLTPKYVPIGVPNMGLSQDNIGQQIMVNFSGDTAHFRIIIENNGNGDATDIKATLMIIPANGNLIKLDNYPMKFKTPFIASKRFYTLKPSTWRFPKTDSIFIYLRMNFFSGLGNKGNQNEKLYLWVGGTLEGEVEPSRRISSFLKKYCLINFKSE